MKTIFYLFIGLLVFCSCQKDLSSLVTGTFTDSRDDQTYKTVLIYEQWWMAENLNYETDTGSWIYDNNSENADIYGRLYNWEAACDACPVGWHLPGDNEWKILEIVLGMSQVDADSSGHWRGTDQGTKLIVGGTSGFDALMGGARYFDGSYKDKDLYAYFWTSTDLDSTYSWIRLLSIITTDIYRNFGNNNNSFSVRCIKDTYSK